LLGKVPSEGIERGKVPSEGIEGEGIEEGIEEAFPGAP
jgi:hypothetical protein